MLVFLEGGEPEFPEKFKPSEEDKNQQQSQTTCGSRSESNLGHTVVRQALAPLHHPCSPIPVPEDKSAESSLLYHLGTGA